MKRILNFSCGILCLALAAIAASGCNSTEGDKSVKPDSGKSLKRVVLLINNPSPYWETARAGMNAASKDLKLADAGLEAVFQANDGTTTGQLERLRQLSTAADVVGVCVSAVEADNLAVVEELRNLRKKGVHVICFDSDFNRAKYRDAREYYIGTDNIQAGRALGLAAKQLLEARKVDHGDYIDFVGYVGAQNAMERMDGFKETMGSAYSEVGRMEDGGARPKAHETVRSALLAHPDLVDLVGIWSYNAPAICDVVEQDYAAKRKQFTITTFDAEPGAIAGIGNGLIDVMVVQDPFDMGYQATRLLKALHENDQAVVKELFPNAGKPDGDLHDTGLKVVVPDDKSPVTADLFKAKFGDTVKFMTLPDFQEWLKKYGLTGS